jgi:hypothetical protein
MKFLATFLTGLFSSIFTLLSTWLGKKAAVTAAVLTVSLAALTTLWAALKGLYAGIVYVLPSDGLGHWLLVGFNLFLPDNWEICIAAMLAADVAVYLYRWNMAHVINPGN